jgi:transposase
MAGVSKLIDEKILNVAKNELNNLGKFSALAIKLKAIIACSDNNISTVANVFKISRTTLTNWIKTLKDSNANELVIKSGRGRNALVGKENRLIIKTWLKNNPNLTIDNIQIKIHNELGINIGRTATYNLIKDLNLSYVTARPNHYKSNQESKETFKKTSKIK